MENLGDLGKHVHVGLMIEIRGVTTENYGFGVKDVLNWSAARFRHSWAGRQSGMENGKPVRIAHQWNMFAEPYE